MRLTNYEFAEDIDKKEWLNSIKMSVGLPYFGGKSIIGRYLLNNIFNLAVQMKKDHRQADIFIDAFTGGGKIGLSIPQGWFDTIVINDLNYGVYSYYKCCQDNDKYIALVYMIEKIGKEFMNKDFFHLAAYIRSFGPGVNKWGDDKNPDYVKDEEVVDPLVAAALTFWVTSASYNSMTAPDKVGYNLTRKLGNDKEDKNFERANIEKIIRTAYKRIPELHKKLNNQHYIIENLDYKELIKKYNGLSYKNILGDVQIEEIGYATTNKLWYFDPPYHPYCLYAGEAAGYADTFTVKLANEMIDILQGDKESEYGKLEYFIKSDYDPKEAYEKAKKGKDDTNISKKQREWCLKVVSMEEKNKGAITNLFGALEEFPFCKVCVGSFYKGAVDITNERTIGQEYIWCKGFQDKYDDDELETSKG